MRRLPLRDATQSVEMQGFAYAMFGCMDLAYHLIEMKVGVSNITSNPAVRGGVGVIYISIAIFVFISRR